MYPDEDLIVKSSRTGSGIRVIPAYKWFIDRSTEAGEDADIYEIKPHGGRKWIPWNVVVERRKRDQK